MKALAVLLIGAVAFAVDYAGLERELVKQKQENVLRDLRIERKTGKLREKSIDMQLRRAKVLEETSLVEAYKGLMSAKSLSVRSNGYVGKVLLTDGIALYSGMDTPYGQVDVEKMKVGSLWINTGVFEKVQASGQAVQLPAGGPQFATIPSPPPPPPPPPPRQATPMPASPAPQVQPPQPQVQPPQPQAGPQVQPPVQPPVR